MTEHCNATRQCIIMQDLIGLKKLVNKGYSVDSFGFEEAIYSKSREILDYLYTELGLRCDKYIMEGIIVGDHVSNFAYFYNRGYNICPSLVAFACECNSFKIAQFCVDVGCIINYKPTCGYISVDLAEFLYKNNMDCADMIEYAHKTNNTRVIAYFQNKLR